MSYYDILGISNTATLTEITRAYRVEALKWHPDRRSVEEKQEAEEKFKKINEAYECLRDPMSRKRYDEELKANQRSSFGSFSTPQANATFEGEFKDVLSQLIKEINEQRKKNQHGSAELKAVGWGAAGAAAGYVAGAIIFSSVAIPAALVLGAAGMVRGYTGNDLVTSFHDLSPELKRHILGELFKMYNGRSA